MPEYDLTFGDESEIAAEIRKFLGVGPYEQVRCVTPQFERLEGGEPPWMPKTKDEFDNLKKLSDKALRFLCLRKWDRDDGLWLYPAEWYDYIPEGYEICDIFGLHDRFKKGETDDDMRYGCLPYGFIK